MMCYRIVLSKPSFINQCYTNNFNKNFLKENAGVDEGKLLCFREESWLSLH